MPFRCLWSGRFWPVLLALLLITVCFGQAALAAYELTRHVISNGAANVNQGDHVLTATVGQAVAGGLTSGSYNISIGYWKVRIVDILTGIEEDRGDIPKAFRLDENYPNPFNPATTIPFALPRSSHVTISIYDLTGRKIVTLVDEGLPAGEHSIVLRPDRMASGLYIFRIQASGFVKSRRMVLVK